MSQDMKKLGARIADEMMTDLAEKEEFLVVEYMYEDMQNQDPSFELTPEQEREMFLAFKKRMNDVLFRV